MLLLLKLLGIGEPLVWRGNNNYLTFNSNVLYRCNTYYRDSNDGKVYISFNANEDEDGLEIPYFVCSSVEEMFRLMDEAYEKEIKDESN